MIKIGIIGLGAIAQKHFEAFKKISDVRITSLCTASSENLAYHSEKWGIKDCYTDYREMLANADMDAVLVCVPPYLHKIISLAALDSGKHVLCEKPPAMNAAEALEMKKASESNRKLLMYGFMFRFSSKHRIAREICIGGELGRIYFIKAETMRRYGTPGGWFEQKTLSGGGPVIDFGVHSLDLIMYMTDALKPVKVYSKVFKNIENMKNIKYWSGIGFGQDVASLNDVEEMAVAIISFENGAELFFSVSNSAHIKQNYKSIEILGTKGGLSVDPNLEIHTVKDGYFIDNKPNINCDSFDYQGSLDKQAGHFIDCIQKGIPCISSAEDGVRVMKLVDAIYLSGQTGETVYI